MKNMKSIEVLDHGYVKFVEHWGSDERIIESARMSTGGGFKGWGPKPIQVPSKLPSGATTVKSVPGDERLLRYLYENKHSTPFEMAGLVIEVKAPIFVYRQWHRHRTQSFNEMSARYTPLPAEDYIPTVRRLLMADKKNKQAGGIKGARALDEVGAQAFQRAIKANFVQLEARYQDALADGVPKELARLVLPVSRYSVMRASANLRNWLAFMTLRCDSHAQWEIRQYADAVSCFISERFPRTHELWVEGVQRGVDDKLMREFVHKLYASIFEDWKESRS